jgi:mannose-6-phosphate isomerase
VFKDYIWGGSRISSQFNRPHAPSPCAESWELSCHPDGITCIQNGVCAGTPLSTLCDQWGEQLYGTSIASTFPLLIKLIDAHDNLSVQVHPSEASAIHFNGEPKTEMWYILDATPGAKVYVGLKPNITKEDFLNALHESNIEAVLNAIPAETGAAIFVPGGCVHAIGKGCLVLECQQSANTTYRVYDWERVDSDGIPRETHREEALGTIDWDNHPANPHSGTHTHSSQNMEASTLITCDYFTTTRLDLHGRASRTGAPSRFRAFFAVNADVQLESSHGNLLIQKGRTALIPAAITDLTLQPSKETATVIEMTP